MTNCSAGCPTQDHESYGECLRKKGTRVAWANSANRLDLTREKSWQREIDLYRSAVAQGVEPETTKTADIRRALDISDKTGKPYGVKETASNV